ncbi:hypothetical protein EDC27_0387 [Desulfosoma caldarium]|uniref:Uncharacterized protein n=1 Tax=Desulfosoma caldarium TaxID=610254 RepID=A0A3N1VME2_9BACT|nr:hypothetical protein EDC27_0387 [Desulfosoma caldarium]
MNRALFKKRPGMNSAASVSLSHSLTNHFLDSHPYAKWSNSQLCTDPLEGFCFSTACFDNRRGAELRDSGSSKDSVHIGFVSPLFKNMNQTPVKRHGVHRFFEHLLEASPFRVSAGCWVELFAKAHDVRVLIMGFGGYS